MPELGSTPTGDPLSIDIDRLIGSHACIVANSGGGKSGLIRRLLEITHGRIQHVVLDIEDEFYTLRERYDYVIAGGDGGDAPARVDNAEGLALATLTHGFSLIVQLNDLGASAPMFVGRFLEAMIGAPRNLWRPMLIVLDEAQRFAPQDGNTEATAGVKALTGQGRKRGFTAVLASQRIAKIDADVRGDVNNWLLGRVGQALDRRTMADALGFAPSSAEARQLQGLADRTFWGFGPAISRTPTLFRVDDVVTTPVRPGQAKVTTPPPPEALRKILAGIAATSAEQREASAIAAYDAGADVGALLIEKEAEITRLGDRAAYFQGLFLGRASLLASVEKRIRKIADDIAAVVTSDDPSETVDAVSADAPAPGKPVSRGTDGGEARRRTVPKSPASASPKPSPDGEDQNLRRGRKALLPLAKIYPARLTEKQWATIAKFSQSGGTWGTYKGALRNAGFIDEVDGKWGATLAGVEACGIDPEPLPPPGPELARFWGGLVPGVRRMVDVLIKRSPHFTTINGLAADLAMAAGGGTFGTYVGRLRANSLIEEQGKGDNKKIRLAPAIMGGA